MKRIALGATILCGLSSVALSADIAPAPASDWSGFYIGAFGGGGWGDTDISADHKKMEDKKNGGPSLDLSADVSGGFGGLQAGYDFQHDALLLGVVGDFAFSGISGDVEKSNGHDAEIVGVQPDGNGPPAAFDMEYDWLATLRGRIGFLPTENWLIYGTGGVAWAGINFESTVNEGPLSGLSNDETNIGYAVGGGTEVKFHENWSLFAEALYMDFGDNDLEAKEGPWPKINYDNSLWTVKGGVNFRFN